MKNNTEKNNCIPWIAFGIALLALTITLLHVCNVTQPTDCKLGNYNDIVGIIISSVALVVSIYLIIIGIHAYQIQNEIKNEAKDFEKLVDKNLGAPATQVSETFYKLYSESIELLTIIHNNLPDPKSNDFINELKLAQARFACHADFIDKDMKLAGINLLRKNSNSTSDINLLEEVINNPKSDKDIRGAALYAYKDIKNRLDE